MKYILSKNGELVVFSNGFSHKDVANKLGIDPKAAGFVRVGGGDDFYCVAEGRSISLGIQPDLDDDYKIQRMLGAV